MTRQETTKENINKLIEFRQAVYKNGFTARRDALFNLMDALLAQGPVTSFAMLSPAEQFERKWPSLYAAVEDGQFDEAWLRQYLAQQVPGQGICYFALDGSPWPRPRCDRVLYGPPPPREPKQRGRGNLHGKRFAFKEPDEVISLKDPYWGTVRLERWQNLHEKKGADVPYDVIRASVHLEREKPPADLWLAWLPPQQIPDGLTVTAQTIWRAYEARWPIEPGLHFRKSTLGWTMPRFQSKEAGDRWTWLTAIATWMIFLSSTVVQDTSMPWQKAQQRMTPQRVQQSIRPIFALIGTPTRSPKRREMPPGWPKGKRRTPKTRYQAGVTSMHSPTYSRLWLSVEHYAGDTVSCTQVEALVLAAEQRTGLRPRRRTELLKTRLEACRTERQPTEKRYETQKAALEKAQSAFQETKNQLATAQATSGIQPQQIASLERRCVRREKAIVAAQDHLTKTLRLLQTHLEAERTLQARLTRIEQENAANPNPVEVRFRIDAGFGTYDNIAWLIEMGYEIYTKLHNHKAVQALQKMVAPDTAWTRVGKNAEMVAWSDLNWIAVLICSR